jgi:hypothetical protein
VTEGELLRVANPGECNMQQLLRGAESRATSAQRAGAKPASIKALARNILVQQACNTSAKAESPLLHDLLHVEREPHSTKSNPLNVASRDINVDAELVDFDAPYDPLSDPRTARYARVESMLTANPHIRYALISDAESDENDVLLMLAIRDLGTCELAISKKEYDAFKVLRVIEEHSAGEA